MNKMSAFLAVVFVASAPMAHAVSATVGCICSNNEAPWTGKSWQSTDQCLSDSDCKNHCQNKGGVAGCTWVYGPSYDSL